MATTGETVSFRELNERSNQVANLFQARGLKHGDSIAIFLENHVRYLEVAWAAQRSGLYFTAVNSHLTPDEAGYIVDDCGAKIVVSSPRLAAVAREVAPLTPRVESHLMVDDVIDGWESYEKAVAAQPTSPVPDECEGDFMLYSSGTTGRPKGIRRELTLAPLGQGIPGATGLATLLGIGDDAVYLSPAPLYHSAPLAWCMGCHRLGATAVVMERFDPEFALQLIERHHITHSQWVPTMFVRMLKLPPEVRERYDLSSLQSAVHAAAPCPVETKRQMIEWWGPIISEYYSATEGMGATFITSEEWLAHPGSVGRSILGEPKIIDDEGNEVPVGEPGVVWFLSGNQFKYHNDPEKTAEARHADGLATVGDIGYLDDEGYLYLTDRKTFMIVSGGVNIYPQEAENLLVTHPKVLDAAVIGVPNDDLGEEVKAVIQPVDWSAAGPDLEQELIAFCKEHLASYKCPRTVDFEKELPRLDTGKLYKRVLRDRYWEGKTTRIGMG
jgi:long-chain acyl-CoA synthetase